MAGEELVFVEGVAVGVGDAAFVALEAALAVGDFVHEALEDEKAGVASYAAAVWVRVSDGFREGEGATGATWEGWKVRVDVDGDVQRWKAWKL